MDNQQDAPHQLPAPPARPRRFIYRSAQPDSAYGHPMRRATDIPQPFRGVAGEVSPSALLLKFRVYMRLN
jgi:hypothetical protein